MNARTALAIGLAGVVAAGTIGCGNKPAPEDPVVRDARTEIIRSAYRTEQQKQAATEYAQRAKTDITVFYCDRALRIAAGNASTVCSRNGITYSVDPNQSTYMDPLPRVSTGRDDPRLGNQAP